MFPVDWANHFIQLSEISFKEVWAPETRCWEIRRSWCFELSWIVGPVYLNKFVIGKGCRTTWDTCNQLFRVAEVEVQGTVLSSRFYHKLFSEMIRHEVKEKIGALLLCIWTTRQDCEWRPLNSREIEITTNTEFKFITRRVEEFK